jgi:hypothetical protein
VPALVEQDVLGLHVAVHDAARVRVGERAGDLARQPHRLAGRQRAARQPRAQRLPRDVGRHVVEPPGRLAAVEQRQDVRVLQRGGHRDLAQEPLGPERGRERGGERLDGHGRPWRRSRARYTVAAPPRASARSTA